MLKVSLKALERGEVAIREQVAPDDALWEGAGVTLSRPLEVELAARSVGEGVLVRGRLRTAVRLACRRCLTQVEREIDDTVDLLFEPIEDGEDDADGEVYPLPPRGDTLDLGDAVREQLLLRAPAFALCTEACRGLCARCGADLNQGECDCVPEAAESPWDALRNVKFD
jgi:uncharacterized protein